MPHRLIKYLLIQSHGLKHLCPQSISFHQDCQITNSALYSLYAQSMLLVQKILFYPRFLIHWFGSGASLKVQSGLLTSGDCWTSQFQILMHKLIGLALFGFEVYDLLVCHVSSNTSLLCSMVYYSDHTIVCPFAADRKMKVQIFLVFILQRLIFNKSELRWNSRMD